MRRMPPFGRGRIRRFWHDVASKKKLAARDYEAYLVVSFLVCFLMNASSALRCELTTSMPGLTGGALRVYESSERTG